MRRKLIATLALASASLVCWFAATHAAAQTNRRAAVTITADKLEIDGALDEPAWTQAAPLADIRQREPRQETAATERTEVRLLADQENLYIGVVCHDAEPAKVVGTQMARDAELEIDDSVAILLDTFHDRRNAFYFATNPAGALVDGLIVENARGINFDWNAIWLVRTQRTAQGWSAEFAIPFKSLSFNPGQDVWGFNFSDTTGFCGCGSGRQKSLGVLARSRCILRVMKPEATSPRRAPHGSKQICLPFESEAHYEACVNDLTQYRAHLTKWMQAHPTLFPKAMHQGYKFHAQYRSRKQHLTLRRVKLPRSGQVFTIRPSFVTPYLTARTDAVEKGLYLRQWSVPYEALAYVCGRDPMFWYRAEQQFGRPNLVGTTVKDEAAMPRDLVADEKITWLNQAAVCLPTTVGGGCVLGISVAQETTGEAFKASYGEFVAEAAAVFPDYVPQSVCTDGYKVTRWAWLQHYPRICLVLCYLHGVLKLRERCKGGLRTAVLDRVWHVYEGADRRQFRQRLRRFHEWAQVHLRGPLLEMAVKLWQRGADYAVAYQCPTAARTSNQVDRLLNHLDRVLYTMRYGHGTPASLRLAARAWAMQWNFHPYGVRLRRDQPERCSPFADLNGFQYHENWLHNFYIAASMGGLRL